MKMADEFTATIGFIAMASSLLMSISPIPFVWRLVKNKDTEEFHPYPFIASSVSHFVWFSYCLNGSGDSILTTCLFFCCIVGITFDLICTIGFCGWPTERISTTMGCLFLTILAFFFFVFGPLCVHFNDPARKVFLGTLGVVSGTLMNLSPLSNITLYKSKSSKYMPHIRCITMFLNSICWFTFNCILGSIDPYIAITNGIGILSGLVILVIIYKFWETPPNSQVLKRLEAKLNVDPRKEIVVLNRICPRCNDIMFEKKDKIKFLPATKYMFYQNEGCKRWRVNAVATTDRLKTYTGISDRFDKLSLQSSRNTLVLASTQTDSIADQVGVLDYKNWLPLSGGPAVVGDNILRWQLRVYFRLPWPDFWAKIVSYNPNNPKPVDKIDAENPNPNEIGKVNAAAENPDDEVEQPV